MVHEATEVMLTDDERDGGDDKLIDADRLVEDEREGGEVALTDAE